MNSITCNCYFNDECYSIVIEIINNINGNTYKRFLTNTDIANIDFDYDESQELIKKQLFEDGTYEIKIIKINSCHIINIKDLYNLIKNKDFEIFLFDNCAIIENTRVITFNITINNINNISKYDNDHLHKIEYYIINGYEETHIYKNYIYKTSYLKNFINIELINDSIKYNKIIYGPDIDKIFDFKNYSLYDYYILILHYIKNNKIIIVEFIESGQIEIIFDNNLNYHIFLDVDKKIIDIPITANKELFTKIEKDLEEFKDYLICNKSDNNLLIEIERRISYRINKLKLENDYIFI